MAMPNASFMLPPQPGMCATIHQEEVIDQQFYWVLDHAVCLP